VSSSDIFFGEVVGTAVLTLLGGGVCAAVSLKKSKAFEAGWVAITFGWSIAVLAGAYISFGLSGGHLNPAVTIGVAIDTGEWGDVPTYLAGQMLGSLIGPLLVWLAYYGHFEAPLRRLEVTGGSQTPGPETVKQPRDAGPRPAADPQAPGPVLGVFATAPEIRNPVQNVVTEAIATAVLILLVLSVGINEGLVLSGTGVLIVALTVLGLGLSLGGPTGYAINPVRDLGPRIVHALLPLPNKGGSDWGYAWIPVVGPVIGAVVAAGIHNLIH
jgi:glycerol uptake facilitator protein